MSIDIVDDLHAAEDRIGDLTEVLASLRNAARGIDPAVLVEAIGTADAILAEGYCRPSCYGFAGYCQMCRGYGVIEQVGYFASAGPLTMEHACPACYGDGSGCDPDDCGCPCGHQAERRQ